MMELDHQPNKKLTRPECQIYSWRSREHVKT